LRILWSRSSGTGIDAALSGKQSQVLAHEKRGLRIVVVAFAMLVTALLVERDGWLEIVVGVQVNPFEMVVAGVLFKGVEEHASDMPPPCRRSDVEAFAFAGIRYGR
jgi:hypothetical protein